MPISGLQMRRVGVGVRFGALQVGRRVASVRTFAVGANQYAALSATVGETLSVPVTVTNGTGAPIIVTGTLQVYEAGGTPSIGTVNLGGTVYPVSGNMTANGAMAPQATLQPGASATWQFVKSALAAVPYPEGVFASVEVADASGNPLPSSPLQAWTNAFLTVGAGATSGSIGFGSPVSSSLPLGGTLTMQGASVSIPGSTWWTLAVSAVDQNGSTLGGATLQGQGAASGLGYTIGPLNEAGAQVHLSGTLSMYADGARTQPFGSPVTASSGVVASTVAAVSVPTAAPVLSGSVVGNQATIQWSSVPNASAYEVDAGALQASWGNGTITYDAGGGVGFFTTATSGATTLPYGTTSVRVRGTTGIGASAQVGPWSNILAITVSGTPAWALSNLQPTYLVAGQAASFSATLQNIGTGPGVPGLITVAAFDQNLLVSTGAINYGQVVQPGQPITVEVTANQGGGSGHGGGDFDQGYIGSTPYAPPPAYGLIVVGGLPSYYAIMSHYSWVGGQPNDLPAGQPYAIGGPWNIG